MYIMRLGVIEAFNTPKLIRERGTYISYWKVPETHYGRWYPKIKLINMKNGNSWFPKRKKRHKKKHGNRKT